MQLAAKYANQLQSRLPSAHMRAVAHGKHSRLQVILRGTLAGHPANILFDKGANRNYVDATFATRKGIRRHMLSDKQPQAPSGARKGDAERDKPAMLTALQANRLVRKQAPAYLVHVREAVEKDEQTCSLP